MNLNKFNPGNKVIHSIYGECTVDEIQPKRDVHEFDGGWTLTVDTDAGRKQYARDRGGSLPGSPLPRLFEDDPVKLKLNE